MNPTIVSDPHKYDNNYQASNVLTDSGNYYWVATWGPLKNTGKIPSYFVIDLQCTADITKVLLRNSYGLFGVE